MDSGYQSGIAREQPDYAGVAAAANTAASDYFPPWRTDWVVPVIQNRLIVELWTR
jgi:hypothetical protein